MVKAIGDNISMSEYNGLVYLLRKFKKIVRKETINKKLLETDIGTFNISSGFINVGDNFILEDDVKIISQNCLPLTTYYFTFYIVNADTSEEITEVPVTVSGNTDKYSNLEITIPENILDDGEEIRREFKIEVTFQESEGVSPLRTVNLSLTSDKKYIDSNETATVTATILDDDDDPIQGYTLYFNVNGTIITKTTDSEGKAVLTITGNGNTGIINIKVLDEEINIIDYYYYDPATGSNYNNNWWNQGGTWEVYRNPDSTQIMNNSNGGKLFIPSTTPSSAVWDESVCLNFQKKYCVEFDVTNAYNIWIHITDFTNTYYQKEITGIGHYKLLVLDNKIQLWVDNVLTETSVIAGDETIFSFLKPSDKRFSNLGFNNFIIYNLDEPEPPAHNYSLSLSGTSLIQTGDNTTVTATLKDNGIAVEGETLDYEIKHGDTTISTGTTSATDSNGQATISYTGTGVGNVNVIVSKESMLLQEIFVLVDVNVYIPCTSDVSSYFTIPSGMSGKISYSSNGMTISGLGSYQTMSLINTYSTPKSVEVEIVDHNGSAPVIGFGSGKYVEFHSSKTRIDFSGTNINVSSTIGKWKFEIDGTNVKIYKDGTLLSTQSVALSTLAFAVEQSTNRSSTIRDIIIKPL